MIIVSNSSPLIIVGKLGRLSLFLDLFGNLHLPDEVFQEVVGAGAGKPVASEVSKAAWIQIHPCANPAVLRQWQKRYHLGLGEVATILLARGLPADLAILDEHLARELARSQGVRVMGCIGVLELAHRRGFLTDLRVAYLQMLAQGAYIDRRILNRSLASFGLAPV